MRRKILPRVVPAECIEYSSPLFFRSRCTSATSLDTDAVGVPSGMRQKSAVHMGGVASLLRSSEDAIAALIRPKKGDEVLRVSPSVWCFWCCTCFNVARHGAAVPGLARPRSCGDKRDTRVGLVW